MILIILESSVYGGTSGVLKPKQLAIDDKFFEDVNFYMQTSLRATRLIMSHANT